jgi:hypothetical protein
MRVAVLAGLLFTTSALGSSHREAPFLTRAPKLDATDLYAFRSYETGRAGYVTLIANYQPMQTPAGGPNFFALDPEAIYEIHVDNDGNGVEDVTFQFDFQLSLAAAGVGLSLPVGPAGNQQMIPVPLLNLGPISAADASAQNMLETYTLKIIRGARRTGTVSNVTRSGTSNAVFEKPIDFVGTKTVADYGTYAASFVFDIDIPGCTPPTGTRARVFVGQRAEPFAVNLGQIFDVLNLDPDPGTPQANPLGVPDQGANVLGQTNVTTLAIEGPASCLNDTADNTIGVWTTASVRQVRVLNPTATFTVPAREGGAWSQVSRLGMPLVNELVIGVPDKDRFNASAPAGDAQFLRYVETPTLPEVMEIVFGGAGVQAPNNFPRADLFSVFLTGVSGLNSTGTPAEMLRLDTSVAPVAASLQSSLGALQCFTRTSTGGTLNSTNVGCDLAGYPNGRRPGDDVTDITLRIAMGFLAPSASAPSGSLPFVDGAYFAPSAFPSSFPYLNTPRPGAP